MNPNLHIALSNLAERINELTDYRTNCGGCCVVAGMVGQELQRRGVDVLGGTVKTYQLESVDDVREAARARGQYGTRTNWWNAVCPSFAHVLLVFRDGGETWIWDTDIKRPIPLKQYNLNHHSDGYLTPEEMEEISSTGHGWNPTFPRKKIPAIREEVSHYLAQVTP